MNEASGARSMRSGAVMVAGRGVQLALQLGLNLVLARLLTEDEFGVQAAVFPIALLVQGIVNGGLQSAIIQHANLTDEDASALFWASMRWSAGICALMVLVAPVLALFFRDARTAPVAVVWAMIIFIATLSAVHEAWLKRQFRFGAVLGANLAALVVSIAVALYAVRAGASYWTFVMQMAVVELGRMTIVWIICPWRPMAPGKLGAARDLAVAELRAYWRGLAGSRFISWVGEQSDRLTVGAVFGVATLGFYDFAKRWGSFAFLELYTPLTEVAIASLSSVRQDPVLLARYARNAFLPVLATSLPVLGFLCAEPAGVLRFLFGEKWLASAPMLHAIAIAMAIGSIGRLAQWVSLSSGGAERQLRYTIWSTPIFLACVFFGARWGAFGVALGVATANLLTSLSGVFYLLRPTMLKPRDILIVWYIPFVAAGVGAATLMLATHQLPSADHFFGLAVRGLLFLAVYVVVWLVYPGGLSLLRGFRRPV